MRLTTKGRYAVTAMADLALHYETGLVSLAEIAERHGISQSYLEQLFASLRRRGLVDGTRGPGGGYRLSKPREAISVADVIDAVDESVDATRCRGKRNCHDNEGCLTHDLWEDLSNQIRRFLTSVTLADVIEKPRVDVIAKWPERNPEPVRREASA
ncbi:MAG: Rrf2 family transcriptional regulator [Gammaproteobacteria bacterium]|nr:Rrf2 family transcriptional regulator [Gammaproteobacteria bacterium]